MFVRMQYEYEYSYVCSYSTYSYCSLRVATAQIRSTRTQTRITADKLELVLELVLVSRVINSYSYSYACSYTMDARSTRTHMLVRIRWTFVVLVGFASLLVVLLKFVVLVLELVLVSRVITGDHDGVGVCISCEIFLSVRYVLVPVVYGFATRSIFVLYASGWMFVYDAGCSYTMQYVLVLVLFSSRRDDTGWMYACLYTMDVRYGGHLARFTTYKYLYRKRSMFVAYGMDVRIRCSTRTRARACTRTRTSSSASSFLQQQDLRVRVFIPYGTGI